MNRAVELLAQKAARGPGRGAEVKPLRVLGAHPEGGDVGVYAGRYGPYVKWEKVNATLPKELAPEAVTLEEALALIAAKKPAKGGRKTAAKAGAKTAGAKKAPAKKATAKKPAGKKPAPRKTAAE
jgi:DNA topoisomerase-1